MRRIWLAAVIWLAAACGGGADSGGNNGADPAGGADKRVAAAAPAGPGNAAAAGRYELRGGPDAASGLELLPDGRFRFFLSEGALDLHAEGRWTSDGRTVTLNTEPRPTPPHFRADEVRRSEEAPLVVLVRAANGRGIAGIDLRMGFADGRTVTGYTQEYGWHYTDETPPGVPRWVEISLAMYGIAPQRFALDPAGGNEFVFTLIANDLGVQDFRDQVLRVTPEGLEIAGPGGTGLYVRER